MTSGQFSAILNSLSNEVVNGPTPTNEPSSTGSHHT
ncbi:unnamed protein product [Cuscuta europaea]|nr:unnamed protein product [Cuscuta europaea]